ncbi:MAG TPA: hypothetical protein VJT31_07935, partial [Rugosimonospora sp.]|nr:hypothetical protein [Rugosimonospora sp.]
MGDSPVAILMLAVAGAAIAVMCVLVLLGLVWGGRTEGIPEKGVPGSRGPAVPVRQEWQRLSAHASEAADRAAEARAAAAAL